MNHTQIMDETSPEFFINKSMLFVRVALAVLFRIGSILIQVSSIPVNDVNTILLQNIIELSIGTITFFVFGHLVVFGDHTMSEWSSIFTTSSQTEIEYAVYAWTAITTTTAIFTTMTAGRIHAVGYIVITMLISGLLQPIAMRLAWTPDSYARNQTVFGIHLKYVDFGGIGHVHLLAGTAAFLATIFIGRRLIRLKDIDEASLPPSSDTSLTIGYVLVILGTIGLTLPHPIVEEAINDPFGIKCGLAVNGGILAALTAEVIFIRKKLNSWAIARCLQGGLAGIILVSNGTLAYSSMVCLVLGALGGLIFYFMQQLMFKSPLEDYCNVIPVHFYCAFFSVLLTLRPVDVLFRVLMQFGWEIIVNTCLIGFYIICLVPVFLLLMVCGLLRNRQCAIDHSRAMKVLRSQKSSGCLSRLFPPGLNPELLVPRSRVRHEEYQDQRLTEEVEVELKTFGSSTNRKRGVEDDEAGNKKKVSRGNFDEVIDELEDLPTTSRKKRFAATRDIECRFAMVNRTHPLTFKKSCKYQLHGKKRACLGGGDAGFTLESKKGNARKWFKNYEDLPDERRAEVLVEMKARSKGIGQILEGSNALLGVESKGAPVKGNESFEFAYYENLNLPEGRFDGVCDLEIVAGDGKKDMESGSQKECLQTSQSVWSYMKADGKKPNEDDDKEAYQEDK